MFKFIFCYKSKKKQYYHHRLSCTIMFKFIFCYTRLATVSKSSKKVKFRGLTEYHKDITRSTIHIQNVKWDYCKSSSFSLVTYKQMAIQTNDLLGFTVLPISRLFWRYFPFSGTHYSWQKSLQANNVCLKLKTLFRVSWKPVAQ